MQTKDLQGDWRQRARQRWPKLREEALAHVDGWADSLVDAVQRSHSIGRDEAIRQVDEFVISGSTRERRSTIG